MRPEEMRRLFAKNLIPPLIFADWLEDTGFAEDAEMVRAGKFRCDHCQRVNDWDRYRCQEKCRSCCQCLQCRRFRSQAKDALAKILGDRLAVFVRDRGEYPDLTALMDYGRKVVSTECKEHTCCLSLMVVEAVVRVAVSREDERSRPRTLMERLRDESRRRFR